MKVSSEQLLKEISDDLLQFLMKGNLISLVNKIYSDLNINELPKLLKIHFVLTKMNEDYSKFGVIDFVEELTQRIRRIRTITTTKEETFYGEVKGSINWNKSYQQQLKRYPTGNLFFVCQKRERNYDIPPNLILKKLLKIIYEIITINLQDVLDKNYEWLREWVSNKNFLESLKHIYLKNIYLSRIDLTKSKITDRMINRAMSSRLILYKQAAKLLSRYRNLMRFEFDKTEGRELLRNTFIRPDKVEVLFELYWIIIIIRLFNVKNLRYELIKPGSNVIAEWQIGIHYYKIYHDSIGNLGFQEDIKVLFEKFKNENNYIGRGLHVIRKYHELIPEKSIVTWRGRPDIILEKYKISESGKKTLCSVLIGEVKYTTYKEYVKTGLKELLEYIALVKKNNKYLKELNCLFTNNQLSQSQIVVKGVLFTDNVKDFEIENDKEIKLVKFGQIPKLKEIIEEFI